MGGLMLLLAQEPVTGAIGLLGLLCMGFGLLVVIGLVFSLIAGFVKAITTPSHCAVCQSALKRVTERVQIAGKIRTVCANCAREFAMERSRRAVAALGATGEGAVSESPARARSGGGGFRDVAVALVVTGVLMTLLGLVMWLVVQAQG